MNTNLVFTEDFYNKSLFHQGERIYINDKGTFSVIPKESQWNRFKRFITFQQDPNIDQVHQQLKSVMEQIKSRSGPLFSSLKNEVHDQGEKKFECLGKNLSVLREKLDRVGQLNFFSKTILKIVNIARSLFLQAPIKMNTYATISFEHEEFLVDGQLFDAAKSF